ncbi:MAG: SBBP repeat-containing protein, partial [Terriglobia bacterium]
MKVLFILCLAVGLSYDARSQTTGMLDGKDAVLESYRTRPLSFEANEGQTDSRVKFLSRRGAASLFLTATEAVISLRETKPSDVPKVSSIALKWAGANPAASVEGVSPLKATANYLLGRDPSKWQSGISTFGKVRYEDIYPGIDLIYYGDGGNLEYDLDLAPGADPARVRMKFSGAERLEIDSSGDLVVETGGEQVRFHKPVAYQVAASAGNAGRDMVAARFVRHGPAEIGFEMGSYDHARSLIIDPQLTYSTYLGGSGNDQGEKLTLDTNGNAYVVGLSYSSDFPVAGAYQSANGGTINAVVSKLNTEAAGSASLVYSTYLGGSGTNIGRAIVVDSLGQAYIVGDTNAPNFPVTSGAFQTTCKLATGVCTSDVFAAKLNASGTALLYSTYLGGTGSEFGFAVAIDLNGHIFVGANTGSADLPVTAGAYQTTFAGGGVKYGDAWIAKLNPGGQGASDLLYATYLGGSGSEALFAMVIDSTGALCLTGSTTSDNFPLSASAFSTTYRGSGALTLGDVFVTKLNPGGGGTADLLYSTYLGGADDDRGEAIALDASDKIYITGLTGSSAYPVTAGAFQTNFLANNTCNGSVCYHAIVAKIDPTLSGAASLIYSTLLEGNTFDLGHAIALDAAGMVYIGGETAST